MDFLNRIDIDIELNNLILRRGCGIEWPDKVQLVTPKKYVGASFELYWIEVAFEFGRIAIGQSAELFNYMLSGHSDLPELDQAPDNLKIGLIAMALDKWLILFELNTETSASIIYAGLSCYVDQKDSALLEYTATLPSGRQERLSICCDYTSLPIVSSILNRLPPTAASKRVQQKLPLTIPLRIGSSRLAIQAAWSLEMGDVLIIETVVSADKSKVQACIGSKHWISADYDGSGQIQVTKKSRGIALEKQTGNQHELNECDQVSVRLDFDLGQKEISYSELSELTEGYVFDLGKQLSNGIAIRYGWRTIARGELIQIGESRLGVRVVDTSQLGAENSV